MRLRVWLIALATAGAVGAGGHAWAFWTASALGAGTASVASLQAATDVTASSPVGSDTVGLTWSAALLSTGEPAQGYYVTRVHNGDGSTAPACGTSATAPTTGLACDDSTVPDGAYRYLVTALFHSWTAVSGPSNTVTVAHDTSPPTVTVTSISPAPNANGVNNSSPVTVTLSASNPSGSAVASITYWVDAGTPTTVSAATAAAPVTGEGAHILSYFATDTAGVSSPTQTQPVSIDTTAPSVTINQAAAQADPTSASPITFTVVFSETVTGFDGTDVTLTGTAGASMATVTGTGTTYSVAVSGMVGDGTVTASIGADGAHDAAGNPNTASASTDDTVTRDTTAPTAPSAPALTAATDTGPSSTDGVTKITTPVFTGTAEPDSTVTLLDGATAIGSGPASGGTYSITSQPLGSGAHTITARATDPAGNQGPASMATTITIDTTRPTVSITQAAAQADPTSASPVNFTAVFSEPVTGLTGAGVSLSGTANPSTATVSGSGTTYTVAVSGMTRTGTVIAGIAANGAQDLAGNLNMASPGDGPTRTVDYVDSTAPTVAITGFIAAGRTATITGTAGTSLGDAATVTVVLCATNSYPCTPVLTKATLTATVNPITGAWTVTSGDLGINAMLYARATQTDLSTNTGTSGIAGPISTL
jgi:hypothetical protein